MKNRLAFLLVLAGLIGGFLAYRHYFFIQKPLPKMEDRLPDARILGKVELIDFVDELRPLLFKNQVKYRDLISSDFILSQTKASGIDFQHPTYFYVTKNQEVGVLIHLTDNTKVPKAMDRLKSFFELKDTIVNSHVIHKIPRFGLYICYEQDWLFVYRGNKFVKNYFQIKYADQSSRSHSWIEFLNNPKLKNERLALYFHDKQLSKERLNYVSAAVSVDSMHVYLRGIIEDRQRFPIQLKKEESIGFPLNTKGAKHYIDLHLNIDSLRRLKRHYIYTFLKPYAKKANFPLTSFIQAWDGDLCIEIGGTEKVPETYVETEFDEETFDYKDVEKTRLVDREKFKSVLSTTANFPPFLNQLFARGYLRKNNNQYFFLLSPPVKIVQTPTLFYLFTSQYQKAKKVKPRNEGKITYDNAEFYFKIEDIHNEDMYLNVTIPFDYVMRKIKLFH